MRLALAQINPTVGDLAGNTALILRSIARAQEAGADLVVFPELALTGYPPEDLLLKAGFIADNLAALDAVAASVRDITAIVGFVDCQGDDIFNSAAVLADGRITAVYRKMCLPNYGVFDEKRYFARGDAPLVVPVGGVATGLAICEDIWADNGPAAAERAAGAGLIVVINASPYHREKVCERERLLRRRARENGVYLAYANTIGGQDELVFDGYSMVIDPRGEIIARAEAFAEHLLVCDIPAGRAADRPAAAPLLSPLLEPVPEAYLALVTGLRDYVRKNGFCQSVIGLSGGIDSSLVAALAVDALGAANVHGVFMPSRFSSAESREDAEELARNLGIDLRTIPIEDIFRTYLATLEPHFAGRSPDITEENLQARIRGNLIMALSNKFNWIVLTTGNKSEMSTGYATLYGDMAGGFAVIKDVSKELVYQLSVYRNIRDTAIPPRVLIKEPTAELRANQKDSDSLPPYPTLDPILKSYVEDDRSLEEIVAAGYHEETIRRVIGLVDRSEYKRRQSPPGIKITPRAFGKDRRMPITNRYNEADYHATKRGDPCQTARRTTPGIVKE
jgi:NAD+ synthase (glutamine-hydrolysing)